MLVASGQIRKGKATVTMHLSVDGVRERPARVIIDTGFDGSMMLPVSLANKLGVIVEDSTTVSMADNSTKRAWTSHIWVRCGTLRERMMVIIEPDCEELMIGMDFIRLWKLSLFVAPGVVILGDGQMFASLGRAIIARDAQLNAPRRARRRRQ